MEIARRSSLVNLRGNLASLVVVVLALAPRLRGTDLSNSITGSVSDGRKTIPYRLFEPQLSSPSEKVPLILFLAGAGDRGTDDVSQVFWMGNLQSHTASGAYAAYVLAPQLRPGNRWDTSGKKPSECETLTMTALRQAMANPNVDTSRIYLTGISLGSKGAWDMLFRYPTQFAAAVPMSYGGDPGTAKTIKDIPIWAFHGSADHVISVGTTRRMIAALQKAGGDPNYTEIAGGSHYIWPQVYNAPDLYAWLFAQHAGAAGSVAARAIARAAGPSAAAAPVADAVLSTSVTVVHAAGEGAADAITVSVPEPTCLSVLGMAATLGLARRRKC
jgi:predicted esterase